MKYAKKGPLFEFLLGRTSMFELIIVAIFISFGINIIGGSFISLYSTKPLIGIYLGIGISLIALLYFAFRNVWPREKLQEYDGFFVIDKNENKLINVPRYKLAESLTNDLNSLFVENIALKQIWDKEPLDSFFIYDKKNKRYVQKEPKSAKLIKEACEYFILGKLSTHLTDYFNDDKFSVEKIHKFQRNEIPDVLLTNRLLELFSKPMEERPMFSEHLEHVPDLPGVTVKCYGKNGANYESFDLVLPVKSKVRRINNDQIEIKTNRFTMNISVHFNGVNTFIAPNFEEYYLSLDFGKACIYKIKIEVKIKFNMLSIFTLNGWEYYEWVDSFLKTLDESISTDNFIERINWNTILTFVQCGKSNRSLQEVVHIEENKIIE